MVDQEIDRKDDRWIEVLSGRAEANDAETRRAARLRAYFERRHEDEARMAPSAEGEARLMDHLARHGVLPTESRAPAATRPGGGRFKDLLARLLPAGPGGYALAAMVVVAVLAVPVLQQITSPDGPGFDRSFKSGPDTSRIGNVETARILAEHPEVDARRIADLLATHGIDASVMSVGNASTVRARIPAESVARVRQALAAEGIAIDTGVELAIEFQPFP